MNDGRQSIDGMVERAVGVLTTSEDGDRQESDTNQLIQVWWSETMQHMKCHHSHFQVDPFW